MPEEKFDPQIGREILGYLEKWPSLAYKPALTGWHISNVAQYARWLESHIGDIDELVRDTESGQGSERPS